MTEDCTGPSIPLDEAEADVLTALRRTALLHTSLCRVAEAEMGKEAAKEFVAKVIDDYGACIGRTALARAKAKGRGNSLADWVEDLPSLGFSTELVGQEPLTARVYNCPLAQVWREEGLEELGSLYCRVDQAKYRAFNPELACVHTVHILRDGTDYCELTVAPEGDSVQD